MVDVRSVRIHGDRRPPPNPLGGAAGENGTTLRAEEEHRSATCRRNIEPSLSSVTSDPSNVDIVGYCHVTMKTFSYKSSIPIFCLLMKVAIFFVGMNFMAARVGLLFVYFIISLFVSITVLQ